MVYASCHSIKTVLNLMELVAAVSGTYMSSETFIKIPVRSILQVQISTPTGAQSLTLWLPSPTS